jgi:nucleoside-diphosphate-sugar epimerase
MERHLPHKNNWIVGSNEPILVTGSNGFIGSRVVDSLLRSGFTNLRCFVRPASDITKLLRAVGTVQTGRVEIVEGNLLSREDCTKAARGARIIFHLAAGMEKTFPGAFMNSVLTTRNLLDASLAFGTLKRFVNISSFAVYSNWSIRSGGLLDESCPLESRPVERAEPYVFAKLKQDEIVREYAIKHGVPFVILRPGAVYGPENHHLSSRIGIDTFGVFIHLGGRNQLPLSYVDNCADAITLAGLTPGVDGEVFNVVDDDLPSSRQFLRSYKEHGKPFPSIYIPYYLFYSLSWLWEKYSKWSKGQLPPAFNRRRCAAYWKGNRYTNAKLKALLGWVPRTSSAEALRRYFGYVREEG